MRIIGQITKNSNQMIAIYQLHYLKQVNLMIKTIYLEIFQKLILLKDY